MGGLELYKHNQIAYEKVEEAFKEDNRAAVIHPTGTGKSYIAFALVGAHPEKRFLWLAPSEYIYNLQKDKLKKKEHIEVTNVDFHTYVWLMRNEDKIDELKPDYIILDEFHRVGAVEWGKSVQKLLDTYPDAKVLGLSATNVRYLDNQRDMADELFYGRIASEIGLCEAIARRILPEPKYVISVYSYEEQLMEYERQIKSLKNKRQSQKVEKLLEKLRRALEKADGVDKIFKKHIQSDNSKIIVFCANADHMIEMMEKVPYWFGKIDKKPNVYHVYTYNPDSEEDFRRFVEDESDHLKLLFCIDMLNEGIHIDDVDAVVLCRPTVSPIVYKQQIGRAIASGSTKKPIIFDMVNNFDNLYQIDALKEEFDELIQMFASSEGGYYEVEGFEIVDELADCRAILEQIQRNLDSTWDIYYQELSRYKRNNGDVKVPKRYVTDDGLFLGQWLLRQRSIYNENKLSEERAKLLEMLGVVWDSDSNQRFERWIELLKKYKEEYGNLNVPSKYVTDDGENLGNFCYNIRGRYKRGKVSSERIEILNNLGFVWETFSLFWDEGYAHAKAYYEEHGDINVKKRYECEDGYKLGLWLFTQRNVRKGKVTGNLDEEKIKRLDELGMEWEVKTNDRFNDYLEAFKNYLKKTGDSLVPYSYVDEEGMALGQWAARMNRLYFSGKLPENKMKDLVKAGFVFDNIPKQWKMHYVEAKAFFKKYGNLDVPVTYTKENGGTLSQWINTQRTQYRRTNHGRLSDKQARLLEEIHINDEDRLEKSFLKGLEEFRKYVESFHDNLVPSEYKTEEGYSLGRWLCRQRKKYSEGNLTEDQIRALDDIGMVWESTEKARAIRHWNEMFEEAKKYAEEHGSMKDLPYGYVTESGKQLGTWVAQQRRIRKGTISHSIELTEERIAALDALGINWGRLGES